MIVCLHAADIGLAGDDARGPHRGGQHLLVAEAVLQRHHDGLRADDRRRVGDGPCGVERLDEHDHEIGRADAVAIDRGTGAHDAFLSALEDAQPVAVDRRDMVLRAVDQPDLRAGVGQGPADRTAQRARTEDAYLHVFFSCGCAR
jgi:hypothetical protein